VLGGIKAGAASRLRCAQALTPPPLDGPTGNRRSSNMELKIYGLIVETIGVLRVEMDAIQRRNADLAEQMRRAAASIALNTSEGSYSRGRNRQARYHTALGSARETLACIEVAVALGYIPAVREDVRARLRQILGTLTNLSR